MMKSVKIDQFTKAFGVIGFPLRHTLSPELHNTAFNVTGQNAVYLAFETKDLAGCVEGAKALGIRGMSVTLPHKSAVMPLLDATDPLAERIGAVNTILNENGRLKGYNTDALGALRALQQKVDLSGKRCLIIGAGGAARAVGFMLREQGVDLSFTNRSSERGRMLAGELGCPFVTLNRMESIRADLLIQTTSVGMYPEVDQSIVPEGFLKKGMTVMDIIYNPVETKLLRSAKERGCMTVSGLSMFVQQGAEQFRIWTGIEPPVEAMTEAVVGALNAHGDPGGKADTRLQKRPPSIDTTRR